VLDRLLKKLGLLTEALIGTGKIALFVSSSQEPTASSGNQRKLEPADASTLGQKFGHIFSPALRSGFSLSDASKRHNLNSLGRQPQVRSGPFPQAP